MWTVTTRPESPMMFLHVRNIKDQKHSHAGIHISLGWSKCLIYSNEEKKSEKLKD